MPGASTPASLHDFSTPPSGDRGRFRTGRKYIPAANAILNKNQPATT
jgi:hypothetical protein